MGAPEQEPFVMAVTLPADGVPEQAGYPFSIPKDWDWKGDRLVR
jgi:hypothetical protein